MKAVLLNGSPRAKGNTFDALSVVKAELTDRGIDAEIVQLGGNVYSGCRACGGCGKNKNRKCVITDDKMNDIFEKVFEADAVVIGSPTYFSNVTTEVKAFIDRCGFVGRANGGLLKHKVGAPVVIARRCGANFVYSAINYFFGICEMTIATSTYWNMVLAGAEGSINEDLEGVETLKTLGENIARLLLAKY